jgi:hypothetical protein
MSSSIKSFFSRHSTCSSQIKSPDSPTTGNKTIHLDRIFSRLTELFTLSSVTSAVLPLCS